MGVYTAEQIAVIRKHRARFARAWEFRFASETVRIWNGNVDRRLVGPQTWIGYKGRLEAPSIPFSSKGENDTGLFVVRGLPARIEDMLWDTDAEVIGNFAIEFELLLTADDLSPVGPMVLSQIFEMRGAQSLQAGASRDGSPLYDLTLMVETIWSRRAEAGFGRYTEADQKGRYPAITDKMFNMVPSLSKGRPIQLV